MAAQSPVSNIPRGRPENPATGALETTQGVAWIDDGKTTNANDGDLCVIDQGVIKIYQSAADTPA